MLTSPPSLAAQEMAPPIVPGVTQLSPERHRAIFGQREEEGEEDSLPRIISEQGYLLARAKELGPEALGVLESMIKAFMRAYRRYPSKMDVMAVIETPNPPLSVAQEEGDPRQVLLNLMRR